MLNRLRSVAFVVVLLGVGLSPALQAQSRMGPPKMSGVWNPVVGSGSVYATKYKGKSEGEMQFAIVGREAVGTETGYWLEVTMANAEMGGEVVYKNLVTLSGGELEFKRMIFQMPGQPPMEMPMNMRMADSQSQSVDMRKDKDAVLIGTESLTVPAGTFSSQHYRSSSGDAWLAADVAPYGIVKTISKNREMVLTRTLTNVRSKITGTPVPFDPMRMMRQPPGE